MQASVTPARSEQTPVPSGRLTRIAQAVALLLAGWLIMRRRTPLRLSGRLALGPGSLGEGPPRLLRAEVTLYSTEDAEARAKPRRVSSSTEVPLVDTLNVIGDLPRALESQEIVLHYQPIVALGDGSVRGAEGLVRWEHPQHGLLSPAAFIQVVEQTGLIAPLTRHVLDQAIAQCARWRDDGSELSVSVNLSVRNLLDQDLPGDVERLLGQHSLPPQALQLEITESMIMSDPDSAVNTLQPVSRTFHGRDLFSPAAAHLAAGVALEELGPPVDPDELVRVEIPQPEVGQNRIRAVVLVVDRFGNVALNLRRDQLDHLELGAGTRVEITCRGERFYAVSARTFADAPRGSLILYEDSYGSLALAVSRGSASQLLRIEEGSEIVLDLAAR